MPSFSIKQKFILIGTITTMAILGVVILDHYSTGQLRNLETIRLQIAAIESEILSLRRNEKDFLARKDKQYLTTFHQHGDHLQTQLQSLKSRLDEIGIANPSVSELAILLKEYENTFEQMSGQQQTIGLSPTDGLYGSLRQAVHKAEKAIRQVDDQQLLADMLMLRRNEKDFMLRQDMKYVDQLQKNYAVLNRDIDNSEHPLSVKRKLKRQLRKYHDDFMALVEGNRIQGLTHETGLMGKMRTAFHKAENMLKTMAGQLDGRITESADDFATTAKLLSLFLVLIVVASLSWFAVSILQPLQRQTAIMRRIASEDNLDIRMDSERTDEIGDIAVAFNRMLDKFQDIINSVRHSADQMNTTADELSMISSGTVTSAKQQASQTEQVTQAINEMFATAQDVAADAARAAEAVTAANDDIHTGQQVINNAVAAIDALSTDIEQASQMINKLEEDSLNIGAVVEVIRDITEQTNLLALNAAIEASRAGEHGRGFAVVADEVRSLASRTHDSTQEIQKMIERLQAGTTAAVQAMEASCSQSQVGVDKISAAGAALGAIIDDIQRINDMNQQIASAAEQQSTVAGQINNNVSEINTIVAATTSNTERTHQASDELSQLSAGMHRLVSRFQS